MVAEDSWGPLCTFPRLLRCTRESGETEALRLDSEMPIWRPCSPPERHPRL